MAKSVMKPRRKAKIPQAPDIKPRRHRTLIVVADGAKARFLQSSEDHKKLVPAGEADMADDPLRLEQRNFTADLAERLDKACSAKQFDRIVLVAPKRSLGELRTLLSPRARKAVSHEVAKDLTASSPTALRKALVDALPEAAIDS